MYMKRNFSKTVCGMIAKGHHMCVSVSLRIMCPCLCSQISPIMHPLPLFNHSDLEFTWISTLVAHLSPRSRNQDPMGEPGYKRLPVFLVSWQEIGFTQSPWCSSVAPVERICLPLQETLIWVHSLGQEDPLEKEMTTYSSIVAWEIPRTKEPGGLQSMVSERLRHEWMSAYRHTASMTFPEFHRAGSNSC